MPRSASQVHGPHAAEVIERATLSLHGRLNAAVRSVQCEYDDGVFVLRGWLSSYYQKQLAQHAVAELDGVRQVVNEIQVVGA